jgi:endonuclease/exonuclease/phosphatase family metal-dependent hydrolase
MTSILRWNIQAATGIDGKTNVDRIANDISQLIHADIICLQEVLVTPGENQVEQLSTLFPQHLPVFGAAVDRIAIGGRLQFGNLVLSRLPVMQIVHHKLPQPAEPAVKHMPRQAIEVIVEHKGKPLRIVTTHLDYFAAKQRSAQTAYLAAHHAECIARAQNPSPTEGENQFAALPETSNSIYCGDFNFTVDSADYMALTGQASPANSQQTKTSTLVDCWPLLKHDVPHAPTCGVFDHVQWQEGAHCRDFFFVSSSLANKVESIAVDVNTAASDHQPLCISVDS